MGKKIHKITFLLLPILAILGSVTKGYSQQESQYTQYMYNTMSINPAYAGSRDVLSIVGLYRSQWVGLDGAPQTANFSVQGPITDRIGAGLSIINDRIGPSNESTISGNFSYHIPVGIKYDLFFGISASANLLNVDYGKLNIGNSGDLVFGENIENKFSPNVGAGVYLRSDNSYIGISVPNILETKRYKSDQVSTAQEKMHFYLIGGYVFDLSENLKFKPAVLAKVVAGAPMAFDLSGNFLINEKITLGLAYRVNASVSGLAGFQITEGLFAGYAYDAETTKLGAYNSGSHEIMLRFDILQRGNRVISPRFF